MAGELSGPGDGGRRPVALVTGATRGIGRATATALAGRGYDLVITGRSTASRPDKRLPGTLEEVAADIEAHGAAVEAVSADLSDPGGPDRVVRSVLDRFGRCDLLVNNAAISYLGPFLDVDVDRWRKSTSVNLLAPIAITQGLVRGMLDRGRGTIVNISSRAATDPASPGLPYGVQKAGIERFTMGIARELRDKGVSVACARIDGLVVTEAVEMVLPGAGTADDLTPTEMASALVWIADHPGQTHGCVLTLDDLRGLGALPARRTA